MKQKLAFITNCTSRKELPPSASFATTCFATGDMPREWLWSLTPPLVEARKMYRGPFFEKACAVASQLGADLYIASAGLGIVPADKLIPSYEASFSNEVKVRVCDRYRPGHSRWLKELTQVWYPDVGDVVDRYELIIACVADAYEEPVADTLGNQVLFITTSAGPKRAIVYDRRLNDPRSPYKGADNDFKVRAAQHYADRIYPATEQSVLEKVLSEAGWEEAKRAKRKKVDMDFVRDWIVRNGDKRVSVAYKTLLDQGIGFKVSRFRDAFESVKHLIL